jgi:putative DNA primase/helicase
LLQGAGSRDSIADGQPALTPPQRWPPSIGILPAISWNQWPLYVGIRIEDLDKSRFAMGSLCGKFLFVDDDVRAGARLPDGILNTISEAKEVTGELKFGPVFNFTVRAVPVLLCNNIPCLADLSHGMRRRLMVIPFDRTFTDLDKDPELFDRIVANELPGVLNRALEGYGRLLVRGTFKLPSSVKAATTRWLRHANPLPAFIEACCIKQPEAECRLADFYAAYAEWARQMGYTLTQNRQTVSLDLEHLGKVNRSSCMWCKQLASALMLRPGRGVGRQHLPHI